jgi:hypothetical protein
MGDTSGKEVTLPWKETSPVDERERFIDELHRIS